MGTTLQKHYMLFVLRTTLDLSKCQDIINWQTKKDSKMHYRNGREAKNGDKIVKLEGGKIVSFGVLHSATPGNNYCNGNIAIVQSTTEGACMCDCLHIDDVAEILAEKGLSNRPKVM